MLHGDLLWPNIPRSHTWWWQARKESRLCSLTPIKSIPTTWRIHSLITPRFDNAHPTCITRFTTYLKICYLFIYFLIQKVFILKKKFFLNITQSIGYHNMWFESKFLIIKKFLNFLSVISNIKYARENDS